MNLKKFECIIGTKCKLKNIRNLLFATNFVSLSNDIEFLIDQDDQVELFLLEVLSRFVTQIRSVRLQRDQWIQSMTELIGSFGTLKM